jgi:hypothetical protein
MLLKYNSHTISHQFKVVFSIFTDMCNCHYCLILEHFLPPRRNPTLVCPVLGSWQPPILSACEALPALGSHRHGSTEMLSLSTVVWKFLLIARVSTSFLLVSKPSFSCAASLTSGVFPSKACKVGMATINPTLQMRKLSLKQGYDLPSPKIRFKARSVTIFWFGVFVVIFFFKTESHYIAQVGLKLMILLPQPPGCWDYRCAPPCPF